MGLFRPPLAREGNFRSSGVFNHPASVGSRLLESFFFFKSFSNINVEKVTFLYNNATPRWDIFHFRPHEQLVPEPLISCDDWRNNGG